MKTPAIWPTGDQAWDAFRAFHVGISHHGTRRAHEYGSGPLVLFDTGELICLKGQPDPTERGFYGHLNIELAISDDMTGYRTPTGMKVAKAWLKDAGSQWFLIDHCSGRAVRIDGSTNGTKLPHMHRPGIPQRFQARAYGYIGGAGCPPIGSNQVVVRPPIKIGASPGQIEHIKGLTDAFKMMLTLRDDPVLSKDRPYDLNPVPFGMVMGWGAPDDIPTDRWMEFLHAGVDRPILKFDYLVSAKARGQ